MEVSLKLAALFVNKSWQMAIGRTVAARGLELVAARSIDHLLQLLKQPEIVGALLEDDPHRLLDWLAVLQMRTSSAVPVIVVGGTRGAGMAEALRHGATDYAEHDPDCAQLLPRLEARMRGREPEARQSMELGPYSLRSVSSVIARDGVEVKLTAREFALAWVLAETPGRVTHASRLAARVWGRDREVCKRTLEQHVYKLRRKLAAHPAFAQLRIQAIYGVGYRLDVIEAGHAGFADADFPALGLPMSKVAPMRGKRLAL